MGGHAALYYGVQRNTNDYDFHLSLENWHDLHDVLARSPVFEKIIEGPTWRPKSFRRFLLGRSAGGREEWLDCWYRNHLLAPFSDLYGRHESGEYGGRPIRFLGLHDLIRSKETERETDWQDVSLLEEILDTRNLATDDEPSPVHARASLRSRRGFERARQLGLCEMADLVQQAYQRAWTPITRAYLMPFVAPTTAEIPDTGLIGEILKHYLTTSHPGSSRHLALVEVVRRLYRRAAMAADRAEKQRECFGS